MDNNLKVKAAKDAMVNMAQYYCIALKESGHNNAREMMIDAIAEAINLTEIEKAKIESSDPSLTPSKVIDDMITVIENTEKKRNLNTQEHRVFLKNAVSCLKYLKTLIKKE